MGLVEDVAGGKVADDGDGYLILKGGVAVGWGGLCDGDSCGGEEADALSEEEEKTILRTGLIYEEECGVVGLGLEQAGLELFADLGLDEGLVRKLS